MLKKDKKITAPRYLLIGLFIICAVIFQNTAGVLPEINGIRAFILIPATVCAAMFCGEIAGAVMGLLAGAAWDIFSSVPDGAMALFLGATAFLCAFFIKRYMINSLRVCMLFCAVSGFVFSVFSAIYASYGFGFEGLGLIFSSFYLPSYIYTTAVSPIIYLLARLLLKGSVKRKFIGE